jgi:L-lactate dehydrogenase (cytochrome)
MSLLQKTDAELLNRFPSVHYLQKRARYRIPKYSWEYLDSGTGLDESRDRNLEAMRAVTFTPKFMQGLLDPQIETELFGTTYAAPFGVAPVGLTGGIWPGADKALATMAAKRRVPHVLSTVGTEKPEVHGPLTQGMGWFQLYPPRDLSIRDDLLARVADCGYKVLVVTADIPAASARERQKRAQLTVPPKIGPLMVARSAVRPMWSLAILRNGAPRFKTLDAYSSRATMANTAGVVGSSLGGTLSWDYLAQVREQWKGKLVVKGLLDPDDASRAIDVGVDGISVSNHGGRQLDGAQGSIAALPAMVERIDGRAKVLFDGGVRSGLDVARAIGLGADFVLCGRAYMFGLAALGDRGADHVTTLLHNGLIETMHNLGCQTLADIPSRITR